ncbi:Ig-like domain-containing protein, partial [Arenimonas oryziterrae]
VYPYTICEQLNPTNCDTANATVLVTAAAIVANDDTGSVANGAVGGTAVANVLANDTLNGAAATTGNVTISVITPATNPGVVLNTATGAVTVAPGTPSGTYTIVYQICEQLNPTNCDQATVNVGVLNSAPLAVDDTVTVVESSVGNAINVLANDSDPENDPLTITPASGTTANGGSYSCTATGCTYTPLTGYTGPDSFDYEICDPNGSCDTATVNITVQPRVITVTATPVCDADAAYLDYVVTATNFAPGANPVTIRWLDGTSTQVQLLSGQPLSGRILWPGMVVSGGVPSDWPGWVLVNGLWVQAPDGFESTRPTSTVEFTVNPTVSVVVNYPPATALCNAIPTNQPPVAVDDADSTVGVTPVTTTVLTNDSDPEAGPLTVSVSPAQQPANGSVVVNPDNTVTYTANPGFSGVDTYTYTITDAAGDTATATVTITVTINPIVANDNDASATPVNGATGGTAVANVLVDDTLNGGPATTANVTISVV